MDYPGYSLYIFGIILDAHFHHDYVQFDVDVQHQDDDDDNDDIDDEDDDDDDDDSDKGDDCKKKIMLLSLLTKTMINLCMVDSLID